MLQHNPSFSPMLGAKSPSVLIAVCTHKRPKMLAKCLDSLLCLRSSLDFRHDILVIDNDIDRSAHLAFCKAEINAYRANMVYLVEPIRGIAKARNRAIDYALGANYDYLAFIDDDETADTEWLYELMRPIWKNKPVLYGRRLWDYSGVPAWAIPKAPRKSPVKEGQECKAFTHNVRISRAVFERVRFDEKLKLAGGEDGDYFARARKMGFPAFFASKAITREYAHPERMTFMGQINRQYWTGASSMRELITEKGRLYKIKKIPSILASPFIGLGVIVAGLSLIPLDRNKGLGLVLRGCKHMAKQWGRLMAIYGHVPQSYAKTVGA